MKNIEIVSRKQRLDNLFTSVAKLSEDFELQSHWARYLCVLVSGFLECSIRTLYAEYTRSKAAPYVANYVADQLKWFQNPKSEKIFELVRSFSSQWEEELKAYTEGERKDAIDSIVANRHLIAHGESVGITYARIQGYYERTLQVVEFIEGQCIG